MENFSARLRKYRKSKGMSQAQMAEAIGLARTGYADIEHGVSVRTFQKLPVIAKALGCRIDDLFPEMDAASDEAAADMPPDRADEEDWLQA